MTKFLRGLMAVSAFFIAAKISSDAATSPPPQNLTLQDCLDLALKQNPSILKAQQEIRRSKGVILETRAAGVPQITASGSGEMIDKKAIDAFKFANTNGTTATTPIYGNQQQPWSAQVQASQLLYQGGKVSSGVRAAQLSSQIASLDFQRIVADTILDVRKDFYEILLNEALVEVREQSVTLLEQQLLDAKSRFDVGSVPRFNVLRAEVELENAKPPLIRAQNDLRLSKENLVKLLAIDSTRSTDFTPINFEGKLVYEHRSWELSGALQQAINQRPELQAAERQIGVAKANVKVAASGYQPEASIFGNYGWHDYSFANDPSVTREGWEAGASVSWALFDGMLTRGKVSEARAVLEEANLDYADTRRQVELEVRQGYSDYLQTLELIEAQKKTVEEAEESLRLAEARFRAGSGTQLDVLSAQTALTEARSNEIQALHDYNVAIATLERVTGMTVRLVN